MELQEIKAIWRQYDERLDRQVQLNMHLLRKIELDKARSALRKLMVGPILSIVAGALAQVVLGLFIFHHFSLMEYAIPAILIDLFAVFTVVSSAVQLAIIEKIDYGAPIIVIQQNLEKLRMHRIRYTTMLRLSGPLLWLPVLIVGLRSLYDFDFYYYFDHAWIASQIAFGLIILALGVWLASLYSRRQIRYLWLKNLMDGIAGKNLLAAMASLKEIEDFAKDE